MKNISKSVVLVMLIMLFGSSAYAGDPRCTFLGYVGNAVVGGVSGLLIGDSGRSAGRGAGAMTVVQGITCATQSTRVTTYGGGQGYPPSNNEGYYDAELYTYRPRGMTNVLPRYASRPYCEGRRHFNTQTGMWEYNTWCSRQ